MRRLFEERTGPLGEDAPAHARFASPEFEARTRAFWDDALTRQRFAHDVAAEVDAAAQAWVPGLTRAHRGLFRAERASNRLILWDVWGGAKFVVDEIDDASRDAIDSAAAP